MRKLTLAALALSCMLPIVSQAQEHYTEGPVWEISTYRIKDDKFDAYLKYLRATWLPTMVESKKAGLVLDYKVFLNTGRHDAKDWDVAFATLHASYARALDYSASDEEKAKAIAAKHFKTKDEDKQREQMAPRLDWREFVSQTYVREVTLRPLP